MALSPCSQFSGLDAVMCHAPRYDCYTTIINSLRIMCRLSMLPLQDFVLTTFSPPTSIKIQSRSVRSHMQRLPLLTFCALSPMWCHSLQQQARRPTWKLTKWNLSSLRSVPCKKPEARCLLMVSQEKCRQVCSTSLVHTLSSDLLSTWYDSVLCLMLLGVQVPVYNCCLLIVHYHC